MADQKISQLTTLTGADATNSDLIPIVDVSPTSTTKKITRAEFFRNVPDIRVGTTSLNPGIDAGVDGLALRGDLSIANMSRSSGSCLSLNRNTDNGAIASFRRETVVVGSISVTDSATAYNTSSDYRLKNDVKPMAGSVDRLMALKPVNFAWKSSGVRVDGFIAHEAQEVVPEAVTGKKDAVDVNGNPEYQGIDQSKLVPLLVAALQEALARIEALEAK